ncbi:HlyD family efflux transporter periplasmic adaptor subunit [Exilibacterium tricleocarpae]|uniref:HlyD family efflux transporter periplasmic adaptor subunit n=1 Tax=Exilibacterium tricleocarpae TaxID=2591008 RepID=A0A545T5T0_9GAMM|nr:HlyD family efflux transporter periplasmic adaptor subunit [Exilibacterium tricleocarpae]TQV72591.1 HlyD family efflux transporter periplasmic adaptor subunit [Exilibacterium tricleocarpae]
MAQTLTANKNNPPPPLGGMDRPVAKAALPGRTLIKISAGLALLAAGYFVAADRFAGRSLHIAGDRVIIASAASGIFEDYIPVRARVAPLRTVFLDAVQGGRVEEVLVEDGAAVAANQVILRLSNADLQLSVMSTESRVMEQLNAMRDQELRLEQNRLDHKHSLVELNYNIGRLTRAAARKKELIAKAHISQSEYDDLLDELQYLREKRAVTLESQASDEKLMAAQLRFFKEKTATMEANLTFAHRSLQDLTVRAPVAGRLSGFDMEVGQNVPRGSRLGQISNPETFKLVADIDEYYLDRIDLGQQADFERGRHRYQLRVAKIYPNVRNGQFQVDLKMVGAAPSDLRRGQSIQSKLTLGDSEPALLVPNGQFFQDTGGRWAFVINGAGTEAYRRQLQLGRRNNRFIEVLAGLDPGEEVIVSSYGNFRDMDRLKLDRN